MASYEEQKAAQNAEARQWVVFGCKVTGGFVVGIFLISAAMVEVDIISPRLNLYRANTEKQAVIAEQKAKSEAAEYAARSQVTQAQAKADAEVIRARGLAESQDIIASTLTEEYLRYLYIDALAGGNGQIIYVPTEAGLPILEAGRAVTE